MMRMPPYQIFSSDNRLWEYFRWMLAGAFVCTFMIKSAPLLSLSLFQKFLFEGIVWICIGSCVIAGSKVYRKLSSSSAYAASIFFTALIGTLIGFPLALLLGGNLSFLTEPEAITHLRSPFTWNYLSGVAVSSVFLFKEAASIIQTEVQKEKVKNLAQEKEVAEINLKFLQAQIEPHFLFNTLSNILSLLEEEPVKGRKMLLDLTQYLRSTLSKIRSEHVTLEQEEEMLLKYLNIHQIRMDERLDFEINIPDSMKHFLIPPMLLQPLVENSLKHGLEPKIKGGKIWIKGSYDQKNIKIEVIDNGIGLQTETSNGLGIENVKKRLKACFGGQGKIILQENYPSGLKISMEFPNESSHRG